MLHNSQGDRSICEVLAQAEQAEQLEQAPQAEGAAEGVLVSKPAESFKIIQDSRDKFVGF